MTTILLQLLDNKLAIQLLRFRTHTKLYNVNIVVMLLCTKELERFAIKLP